MSKQGPHVRARDGKGNAIRGLYLRDGKFSAGFQENGRWRMVTLQAASLTEAKRERASLVVGLRKGRIASADSSTFAEVFAEWQAGRRIAERTAEHERYLYDRHLGTLRGQQVQKVSASEVARVLRSMRDDGLSEWTCSAVYRIAKGVFSLAVRRGILTGNPVDGLTLAERPKQRNTRNVERLDSAPIRKMIAAAPTGRWRAATRARWPRRASPGRGERAPVGRPRSPGQHAHRQPLFAPDGSPKPPKTDAGVRVVALFPELRQLLLTWKLRARSPYVRTTCSSPVPRGPVQQRNAQRTFAKAKQAAGLDSLEDRLSWHSLRHSAGSVWLTEYGLPVTTVRAMMGHANPSFTLACTRVTRETPRRWSPMCSHEPQRPDPN